MSDRRDSILVVGATGAQGGSVASHLLGRGRWEVRALTRNPGAAGTRRLIAAGAIPVPGDLNNPKSVADAVLGVDALFAVTDYWQHGAAEYEQAKRLIHLALESGVSRIVFSSLPGIKAHSDGELVGQHFDLKYQLEEELRAERKPVAFIWPAFFYTNWSEVPGIALTREADGSTGFTINIGDSPMPAVAPEDIGGVVAAVLDDFDKFAGQSIPITGDLRTGPEYAEILTEVLGIPIHFHSHSWAAVRPGADEIGGYVLDMFEFYRRYGAKLYGDGKPTRALYPETRDLRTWLSANRERFRHLLPG